MFKIVFYYLIAPDNNNYFVSTFLHKTAYMPRMRMVLKLLTQPFLTSVSHYITNGPSSSPGTGLSILSHQSKSQECQHSYDSMRVCWSTKQSTTHPIPLPKLQTGQHSIKFNRGKHKQRNPRHNFTS